MSATARLTALATWLLRIVRPPSWRSIERFDESWKDRIRALAALLDGKKRVLDLGCGPMWLREILPPDVEYVGCDYVSRGPGVLVCDFNRHEFPDIHVDACFVSGCLEYVRDVDWFLARIRGSAPVLVMSYCTTDLNPDLLHRRRLGWVNNLSAAALCERAEKAGFKLDKRAPSISGNELFRFVAS